MIYALAILAIAIVIALWVFFDPDRSVMRARYSYQAHMAEEVLSLATNLDEHQLWVALPFPKIESDPKLCSEEWTAHPRRWARVLRRDGSRLFLEEGRIEVLGCDWYIFADMQGKALRYTLVADGNIPPGIDPESVALPDVLIGDSNREQQIHRKVAGQERSRR